MMNLLNHWLLVASLLLLVLSVVIIIIFNIPLQIKEARVKNGLAKLRKQLLAFGFTLIITNGIALYFIGTGTHRLVVADMKIEVNYITEILLFIFSLSHLILAIIGYFIYHQQYTEEHKAVAEKIDKLTKKKNKE